MNVANELTIIISIHNNQEFFERVKNYYLDFPGQKILLDSSKIPLYDNDINNHFDYLHFSNFSLERKLK